MNFQQERYNPLKLKVAWFVPAHQEKVSRVEQNEEAA